MRRLASIAVTVALLAAACGSDSDAEASGLAGTSLTIYSGRTEELVGPLIERFENETGVDVAVRYGGSAELAATLLEEGGNSPADVFFAQDPASLGSVALAGMFTSLPDALRQAVPARFSDSDGRWVGVSGRARTVVYDSTALAPGDLPDKEDGFADPRWSGRVGIAPTNGSFLAFVAAKILLDGEQATLAWLQGMAANQQPTYAKNSVIVAAVDEGEVETGLVNHYYLFRRQAEEGEVAAANYFFPHACAGSLVMPAGAGILSNADNPAASEAFITFLLETESQQYFANETFEYPLIPGVAPHRELPPLDSIPTPDVDLSQLAEVLDRATELVAQAGLL